jgi:pimeloyl-ACP methyl ester carboxylesterase
MNFENYVPPALILLVGVLIVWLSMRRILSLSAKVARRWRRVLERIVLSGIVLMTSAVAGSAAFNAIASLYFWAHNPAPGIIYTVSGYKMHLYSMGSGSPTIILEGGLGSDSLDWGGIQPALSKITRVCAYDRSGFGWSDSRPAPRDADHIAAELHGLLMEAKINEPIVLMGHSIAGVYMRDYASHYPANLAGIVFLDGSTPFLDHHPAFTAASANEPPRWAMTLKYQAVQALGIPRLQGQCSQLMPGFETHAARLQAEDGCCLRYGAMNAEMDSIDQTSQQTVHTGPYADLPILIFSRDPTANTGQSSAETEIARAWDQMQENLKKLSKRSRRIIAKGSTHWIYLDRADLIKKEVTLFIQQIRGTAPQPANYGSTITE